MSEPEGCDEDIFADHNRHIEELRSEIVKLSDAGAEMHYALKRVQESGVYVGVVVHQLIQEAIDSYEAID